MGSIEGSQLKCYWRAVSSLGDRLVAATAFMRDWASELQPQGGDSEYFRKIMEDLLESNTGGVLKDALSLDTDEPQFDSVPDTGRQLVSGVNNVFLGGLKLLTEELIGRIQEFPPTEYHDPALALLSANVHTLVAKFGSFTAAWDQLVTLKYETSVPDRRRRRFDAWFTTLVGTSERFLRDVIGVTVLLAGKEIVSDALLACYRSKELGVPPPTAEQLIQLPSADVALTESIMNFMDRGARHTTHYAEHFAAALGTSLFPPNEQGFQPGILSELPMFGSTSEQVWIALLDARKAIVHETTHELRSSIGGGAREVLYGLSLEQLELVAEYLCAFSFGFGMRILSALGQRAEVFHRQLVSELRHRHSGELRVLVMRLLAAQRYGLAWALSESALSVEPADSSGTMLRLNSFFARQKFGRGYIDRAEIESLETGDAPRYELLQHVLLGNVDRNRLAPLLRRSLDIRDLSLSELDEWPALESLRNTTWWTSWRRDHVRRHGA